MQVVGYEAGADPALRLSDGGTVRSEPLRPGEELAFTLERRHCAGRVEDGVHHPCDASEAPYCPEHTSVWPCARCVGNCELPLESCREEHAVYLAAFAPRTFKVGVTRSWRLETRLREQGADRAAHVHTVSNGRVARELEGDIAATRGITDRVRVPAKVRGLSETVDEDAWNALLEEFSVVETFDFEGVALPSRPLPATMATGTVRGVQGRVLVLDREGTTYAVDLRDLVGYDLHPEPATGERQASLGAFDTR